MRRALWILPLLLNCTALAGEPPLIVKPDAFPTLVNPNCSHCRDEAKRRAGELRDDDRILCWTRGYSDGGAIPFRFFLNRYRVISDSYGVFVYDPDAGFARGYLPSYQFEFEGWRNGVMVMKHKDGTLFSCLSGMAFDGPRKGIRLTPIPTLVSDWGFWMEHYPHAVAYHMFEKYQPVDVPAQPNADSQRSRGTLDPRLNPETTVLGVWGGKTARAYPLDAVARAGLLVEDLDGKPCVVLWVPKTHTAAAYRPEATAPVKYPAPHPDKDGVSPPDPPSPGPKRAVTLKQDPKTPAAPFVDQETGSHWDIAGRAVDGELKGYTLTWLDSVQVKWFAWSAENPETSIYQPVKPAVDPNQAQKEIAGTSEFLRLLPKPFGTLTAIDSKRRTVTLLLEGEKIAKTWSVEPDAELKVSGWWGRLEQFHPGERVWVWLKLDRKKNPVSVVMMADELSERDIHGRLLSKEKQVDEARVEQQKWLRKRWTDQGLPGTLTFHHVFSGELELTLDHEAISWGRALAAGDVVHLTADPPIKGVVKAVNPWRERTVIRLVVGELESSELKIGQRLNLKCSPPNEATESSLYPPDLDRPRTTSARIEWFLATIYCPCGVGHDTCTGHFYTLASCNPNGCGMPKRMRGELAKKIERGLTDRQILDELVKEFGPNVLRPHLAP